MVNHSFHWVPIARGGETLGEAAAVVQRTNGSTLFRPPLSAWLPLWKRWKWGRERPASRRPQRGGPRKPRSFSGPMGRGKGREVARASAGGPWGWLGSGRLWERVAAATLFPALAAGFCPVGCHRQRFRFELQLGWSVLTLSSACPSPSKAALFKAQLSPPSPFKMTHLHIPTLRQIDGSRCGLTRLNLKHFFPDYKNKK